MEGMQGRGGGGKESCRGGTGSAAGGRDGLYWSTSQRPGPKELAAKTNTNKAEGAARPQRDEPGVPSRPCPSGNCSPALPPPPRAAAAGAPECREEAGNPKDRRPFQHCPPHPGAPR